MTQPDVGLALPEDDEPDEIEELDEIEDVVGDMTGAPPTPAAGVPQVIGDERESLGSLETRAADPDLRSAAVAASQSTSSGFQATRAGRVGTQWTGAADNISEPGNETPKIRLTTGRVVPGTRYRILRWLGEGGMGVVYEAEHVDIERRVALKILRFDLSQQPRMAQVFRDEARSASRMGSENIVEIYDFGELPDGRLFFCMELLDGRDLVLDTDDDWIQPAELIGVLRQVCKGLASAHDAGIVHRDIKPENLIQIEEKGRGRVKIVDFGISSMLAAGQDQDGGIAGTPHYMAPEQITGSDFDGRLDIYALGCSAYELLVGQPPFDAEELQALLSMHLADEPKPLAAVRPDREIPKPLEDVIMRCLAKEPADRPVNAQELEALLCEAQIAAKLSTPWDDLEVPEIPDEERRQRIIREMPSLVPVAPAKRRWLVPVAGSLFAASAAAAAVYFAVTPSAEAQSKVDQLTAQARESASRMHYVRPGLDGPPDDTALHHILALEALRGRAASLGDTRGDELRHDFSTALVQQAAPFWENPVTKPIALQYYEDALILDADNETALERSGLTIGEITRLQAHARKGDFSKRELALSTLLLGDDDAKEKAVEVLADEETITPSTDRALAAARGAGVSAKVLAKASQRAGEPGNRPTDPELETLSKQKAEVEAELAALRAEQERLAEERAAAEAEQAAEAETREEQAREEVKRARKRVSLGGSGRNPKKAAALAKEGVAALRKGRRSEAESLFNQAIAHDRRNAKALMGLSDVYFDTGQSEKAVLYAERAVKTSPNNGGYRIKLGDAYYRTLRYHDAEAQYTAAKKLRHKRADARLAKVRAKVGG